MKNEAQNPFSEVSVEARKSQVIWLRCVCLSVLAILVVGGITRLTGSGLSMVDWRPIAGILPPITDSQWNEVFDQYKDRPNIKRSMRA